MVSSPCGLTAPCNTPLPLTFLGCKFHPLTDMCRTPPLDLATSSGAERQGFGFKQVQQIWIMKKAAKQELLVSLLCQAPSQSRPGQVGSLVQPWSGDVTDCTSWIFYATDKLHASVTGQTRCPLAGQPHLPPAPAFTQQHGTTTIFLFYSSFNLACGPQYAADTSSGPTRSPRRVFCLGCHMLRCAQHWYLARATDLDLDIGVLGKGGGRTRPI